MTSTARNQQHPQRALGQTNKTKPPRPLVRDGQWPRNATDEGEVGSAASAPTTPTGPRDANRAAPPKATARTRPRGLGTGAGQNSKVASSPFGVAL